MKNSIVFLFILLTACGPRIDLDFGQWEDKAYLTNVQIFTLEIDEHELQEYYENETLTPARRRKILSTGNASIDRTSYSAIVLVPQNTDLTKAGFIFYHQAKNIIPLESSPIAGIITNLAENVNYKYQLISADGSSHDWNITIQVEE